MKTFVRRAFTVVFFLAAAIGIIFLGTPFVIDTFLLPPLLEKITVNNKSASVSRITLFSTRGTLSIEDGNTPIASIPRFELSYTPGSLLNLTIASLTIDHATLHLVKTDNGFRMVGFSPTPASPATPHPVPAAPFIFPLVIEHIILKQCSVILHEPGRSDTRFTLSTRADFIFSDKSSAGFPLFSAEGSFLLSDNLNARGTFNLRIGSDEHVLSVDLQTGLEQLPGDSIGRRNSVYGGMLVEASAVIDAESMQIKKIEATGEIDSFQLNYNDLVITGEKERSSVTFSLGGPPQDLIYSLGPLSLESPISLNTTLSGKARINEHLLQAEGVVGSTISRETEAGIYNHAGPEIGVASTKNFTSQLTTLILIALLLGRHQHLSLTEGIQAIRALEALPEQVRELLGQSSHIEAIAEKYHHCSNWLFLGRKYNYPIALEGALKLKEVSYIHAEGYAAGEMKHGPIALINPDMPTVAIIPNDEMHEKMLSNIHEIKSRKGPVIAIASQGDEKVRELADDIIEVPPTLDFLSPMLYVIPCQLLAYYCAKFLDRDIDKPRNLAKSVTVE